MKTEAANQKVLTLKREADQTEENHKNVEHLEHLAMEIETPDKSLSAYAQAAVVDPVVKAKDKADPGMTEEAVSTISTIDTHPEPLEKGHFDRANLDTHVSSSFNAPGDGRDSGRPLLSGQQNKMRNPPMILKHLEIGKQESRGRQESHEKKVDDQSTSIEVPMAIKRNGSLSHASVAMTAVSNDAEFRNSPFRPKASGSPRSHNSSLNNNEQRKSSSLKDDSRATDNPCISEALPYPSTQILEPVGINILNEHADAGTTESGQVKGRHAGAHSPTSNNTPGLTDPEARIGKIRNHFIAEEFLEMDDTINGNVKPELKTPENNGFQGLAGTASEAKVVTSHEEPSTSVEQTQQGEPHIHPNSISLNKRLWNNLKQILPKSGTHTAPNRAKESVAVSQVADRDDHTRQTMQGTAVNFSQPMLTPEIQEDNGVPRTTPRALYSHQAHTAAHISHERLANRRVVAFCDSDLRTSSSTIIGPSYHLQEGLQPILEAWVLKRGDPLYREPESWIRVTMIMIPIEASELEKIVAKQSRTFRRSLWHLFALLSSYQQQQINRLIVCRAHTSGGHWTLQALKVDPKRWKERDIVSIRLVLQRTLSPADSGNQPPHKPQQVQRHPHHQASAPIHPDLGRNPAHMDPAHMFPTPPTFPARSLPPPIHPPLDYMGRRLQPHQAQASPLAKKRIYPGRRRRPTRVHDTSPEDSDGDDRRRRRRRIRVHDISPETSDGDDRRRPRIVRSKKQAREVSSGEHTASIVPIGASSDTDLTSPSMVQPRRSRLSGLMMMAGHALDSRSSNTEGEDESAPVLHNSARTAPAGTSAQDGPEVESHTSLNPEAAVAALLSKWTIVESGSKA